jgi:eukaryotic-like serine/threonine-protein kinase
MQKGTSTSDRIGGYRVLRQLSVIGPVQIHLACEEALEGFSRNVVLKIVPNGSGRDADETRELLDDVTACAELTHPSVVRTHQIFLHDDAVVLALEYLDGTSLAELLARHATTWRRCFSDDAALHVGLSICDALAHAHAMLDEEGFAAPIVHRAVNPSNVLIGRDGLVKLDGFGFAKILGGVATDPADGTTWTPAYLAPEQIAQHDPNPQNDVYAAGLILWELLTGRTATVLPRDPFAIEATFKAVAGRKLEPLRSLRPDLPLELARAVDAALAPTPDQRIVTCAEMARLIRKVLHVATGKAELRRCVNTALAAATSQPHQAQRDESPTLSEMPRAAASALPDVRASHARPRLPPPHPPASSRSRAAMLHQPGPEISMAGQLFPPIPAGVAALSDPPASSTDTTEEVSESEQGPTGVWEWSSLVSRLHAPTPWRRTSWLVAWVGLTLCLIALVAKLTLSRAPTASIAATRMGAFGQTFVASPMPSGRAEVPHPHEAPGESEAVALAPEEPAPNVLQPSAAPEGLSAPPTLEPGFGRLTVHSTASHANVHVDLKPYGSPGENLSVPCGKRFVSVGIPARRTGKPVWLAPGKMIVIPCGAAFETTLNPRPLR